MSCEQHKNALVESAASGSEPLGKLRTHLTACAPCRALFAAEQQLYAAIDDGFNAAANAVVPASLLPRVRAALDQEVFRKRGWAPRWLVLVGAATAIAALFVTQSVRRTRTNPASVNTATNPASLEHVASTLPAEHSSRMEPTPGNNVLQLRASVARNHAVQERRLDHNLAPEILVPKDQEVLLARYAEEWRSRKRAPLLTEVSSESAPHLLQIAPIQIAQLDVKLLEEKSQ